MLLKINNNLLYVIYTFVLNLNKNIFICQTLNINKDSIWDFLKYINNMKLINKEFYNKILNDSRIIWDKLYKHTQIVGYEYDLTNNLAINCKINYKYFLNRRIQIEKNSKRIFNGFNLFSDNMKTLYNNINNHEYMNNEEKELRLSSLKKRINHFKYYYNVVNNRLIYLRFELESITN